MSNLAFKSGTVSGFSGAGGLLQALLDFVVGTEVTGENLSGSGTSWSGTLAQSPVGYGRLTVDYIIGGQAYEASDDGTGNIVGTNISAGTIDYTNGDYSITFSSSPTGTPTADYLYGEPGQDWKLLMNQNTENNLEAEVFGSDCKEVILQNTGLSGLEQVIVGIREWRYIGANSYGWNLNGYLWFNEDMSWRANILEQGSARSAYDSTYNTWRYLPNMPLVDTTMYYWFFSNRQRIIVVVKVQSNYESCYLGFGNRYASPSRYPYPLCIKGSHYGLGGQADTGNWRRGIHRNYWGGDGYPLMPVDPGSNWKTTAGASVYVDGGKMFPGDTLDSTDGQIGVTLDGDVFSMTVCVYNPDDSEVWFDLDGVKQLFGPNIQSEDIIRDFTNKLKYRIFQDISRTSFVDFFSVEQGVLTTTTT